jgi:hypothetical protein
MSKTALLNASSEILWWIFFRECVAPPSLPAPRGNFFGKIGSLFSVAAKFFWAIFGARKIYYGRLSDDDAAAFSGDEEFPTARPLMNSDIVWYRRVAGRLLHEKRHPCGLAAVSQRPRPIWFHEPSNCRIAVIVFLTRLHGFAPQITQSMPARSSSNHSNIGSRSAHGCRLIETRGDA